jgi:serine/threonine protein kinase
MIGTTIGHYQILEMIGAGGMGEVYRARDTKLLRMVAVKVLPAEFADDPERAHRFEREAHLLASLNHPHVAAIHGLEEHGGKRFLVLELVEGQTLADRLKKGGFLRKRRGRFAARLPKGWRRRTRPESFTVT